MPAISFDLDQLALAIEALTFHCRWPVGVLVTATAIDAGTPLPHIELFPLGARHERLSKPRCSHIDRTWQSVLGVSGPATLVDVSSGAPKSVADEGAGHLVHLVDDAGNRSTRLSRCDRMGTTHRVRVDLSGGDLDAWCANELKSLIAFQ